MAKGIKLDLRAQTVKLWREKLPADLKAQVPEVTELLSDEDAIALVQELSGASANRIPKILLDRGAVLSKVSRAFRIRILAWSMNRAGMEGALILRQVSEVDDESGSDEGGRALIADLFKEDLDAIGIASMSRVVRAATDKLTLTVLDSGLKDFQMSADLQRHGGM